VDVSPADAAFLTSPEGEAALCAAREVRDVDPVRRRRALAERTRGRLRPEEERAALAQDALRARAARKTPLADRLLFTRDALEQATPSLVADERARAFAAFPTVADLGAGVGLDAIALACSGRVVRAVERDPVRAAFLRWNVEAAGLASRVATIEDDLLAAPPAADAAFLDPDRRPGGARTRDPRGFEPPPDAWERLAAFYGHLLVKLPPVPPAALEREPLAFVSLGGEMKEARLGRGALRVPVRRRAVVLPGGATIEGEGAPWPPPRGPQEGDVLLDPDPAVVVAGLVGEAAAEAGAAPIHPRIAYLLGHAPAPWASAVRVEAVLPAAPRAIQAALDRADVGDLTIRARGVSDPPERWRARLRPRGRTAKTLVLARGPDDRWVALLGSAL